MKARRDGMCQACAASISTGDDVVPIQPSQLTPVPKSPELTRDSQPAEGCGGTSTTQNCGARSARSIWIHAACAASLQSSGKDCQALTVCKHWRKTGTCLFGSTCTFAHPAEQAGEKSDRGEEGRSWQSIAAAGGPVHLHATGIPLDVDMQHLMWALEEHGKVLEAVEVKKMKRYSSGWAVVKYASFEEANRAVSALNGKLKLKRNALPAAEHTSALELGEARTSELSASPEEKEEEEGEHGGGEKTDGAAADLILEELAWQGWEEEEEEGEAEEGEEKAGREAGRAESGRPPQHAPVLRLWFAQLKRKKIRNEFRVAVFRRWLLDTFGAARLRSGSGVLDVAGGKGELAFELLNLSGIPCTVVEPRPLQLGLFVRRLRMGLYHRNRMLARYNCEAVAPDGDFITPPHLRIFFEAWPAPCYPDAPQVEEEEEEGGEGAEEGERRERRERRERKERRGLEWELPTALQSCGNWEGAQAASRQLSWTKRGLGHEQQPQPPQPQPQPSRRAREEEHEDEEEEDEEEEEEEEGAAGGRAEWERMYGLEERAAGAEVRELGAAQRLVRGASALVGMHPDQFRTRRLRNGRAVTNYDSLIQYLCEMDEGIQVAELPFEGKNKVLFHFGRDAERSDDGKG